jgi:hypothetical protein
MQKIRLINCEKIDRNWQKTEPSRPEPFSDDTSYKDQFRPYMIQLVPPQTPARKRLAPISVKFDG